MVEPKLRTTQIIQGVPVDSLRVEPQSTPDDTVRVTAGNVLLADDVSFWPFTARNSSAFSALGGMDVSRWDLLTIDITSTPLVLDVTPGTPSASPQDWEDGIPDVPADRIPLAAIHVTEVAPASVIISSSDIVDLRAFFQRPVKSANRLGYTVGDSSNWLTPGSPPTVIKDALDELADRLSSGGAGGAVDATAGAAGTSKIAARQDHVHAHGDLSGVITTHHDALQLAYSPSSPGDWLVVPSESKAALDELASRAASLESNVTSLDSNVTSIEEALSLTKVKRNTTARANTTTLADDPDFSGITLEPGHYILDGWLWVETFSQTEDFKWSFAFTGSAFASWITQWLVTSPSGVAHVGAHGSLSSVDEYDWSSSSNPQILFQGSIEVTVVGDLSIQWAQRVSGANQVNLRAASFLRITEDRS